MQPYHRIYAEISLDALEANIRALRAKIKPDVKVMAVIKADGYGHGASAIARFLAEQVEYFAVSVLEEALQLRLDGITYPLMILGYTSPSQFAAVVQNDITQTVFTLESAQALSEEALRQGKKAKIHIAVDTGMARIGFLDTPQAMQQIEQICRLPGLVVEGIFSHLACADMQDKSSAKEQYRRFTDFIAALEARGLRFAIKHISNSAWAIDCAEYMDMIRFGISMYGLYPSDEVHKPALPLQPVMQVKTHVVHIKTLPAGNGVSYGHTYVTTKPTRIATIPAGYADGYPRALSSQGRVLIHGEYAPIIGRICMDQFMVDISHIAGVCVEDEVVLMGRQGDNAITAEEIGALSMSFAYEVVCRVSQRVPRLCVYKGKPAGIHNVFVTQEQFQQQQNAANADGK